MFFSLSPETLHPGVGHSTPRNCGALTARGIRPNNKKPSLTPVIDRMEVTAGRMMIQIASFTEIRKYQATVANG